jgi:hypothetical protein
VLWISTLRPYPNVLVGSAFGIDRILDLLTLSIVLVFFLGSLALDVRINCPRSFHLPAVVFILLSLLLPLAYWNSAVIHSEPTGIRDLFELVRFPIMLVTTLFLAQVKVDHTNIEDFIKKAFIIPYWIVVVLCIADIVRIPIVSDIKLILWGQSKNMIAFTYNFFRISGTLENPNWFSLYLNMILALFLFFKRKNVTTIIGIMACIALIALTGSLTGMVGLLCLTLSYFVLSCLRVMRQPLNRVIRLAVIAVFVIVGLYIIGSVNNSRISRALALVRSKGVLSVPTANMRASQVQSLINEYTNEPRLLGFGPSKYLLGAVIDNQYIEYLMRYGIVGLSLMMLTYGYYCIVAVSLRTRSIDKAVKDYSLLVCALTMLLLIYFVTGEFGDTLRLSLIYFGFIMPVFKLAQNHKGMKRHGLPIRES